MLVCPSCGQENPDGFKFCGNCAAALAPATATREVRKTVTVLFSDVTGSTALGEQLDPESLRRVMARYFETMRTAIERHGGTVEKFIGDAVMAVFGIPRVHEDDALRAVRAAADMRAALGELNDKLERDYGITLELRIGVNTGAVVTGTEERLATGDAVNTAARLEQAAAPGSVLIGPETMRLVRHAVDAEPVEPLALKGKQDPLPAFRLLAVHPDAVATVRHLEAPLVGRENQRTSLDNAFANVVAGRTCALFTLLGAAGVGKSRLVAEFLRTAEATVLRGRCLPYGEGITYWPVVEVVKQLLGARPPDALLDDPTANAALMSLLGETDEPASAEDVAWAARRLLETAAAESPLVVVFDDIHWGESTFLDLIEHVADWSRDAPILLLCLARPELLDRRPGWGGGKLNATTILLEPLDAAETDELIDSLLAGDRLQDGDLRERIRATAEGNPLFVEEMLAMVRESGGSDVTVPPTIQALLAARLDQLEPGERGVLERGAVEGLSFHGGAVQALAPDETEVRPRLLTLVRKELVRPDRATFPGEDAFRFRHLLIRDAAYDALPKAARAELHERFALWLDERAQDLVERDEIVGYHLEQAVRYRGELGPADDATTRLAAAAAERLHAAGVRALEREDASAARNLLERTVSLLPPEQADIALEVKLAYALFYAEPQKAGARLLAAAERAEANGDRLGALWARLEHLSILTHIDPEGRTAELEALIEESRPVFEAAGYHVGLAAVWGSVCWIEHNHCRFDAAAAAAERSIEHAKRAGDLSMVRKLLAPLLADTAMGSMPVDDYLAWLEEISAEHPLHIFEQDWRAMALTLLGRFDEARTAQDEAIAGAHERGARIIEAIFAQGRWRLEMEAGDIQAAEQAARHGCELLQEMGERGWLSTQACHLAESLFRLGREEEAAEWAELGLELGATDDAMTQMLARQVLAKLAARHGERESADRLIAEAVELAAGIQFLIAQADLRMDKAEVLALTGRGDEAAAELELAAALYDRKGATAPLARARQRLAELASDAE